jgi:hypothetical protein
MRQYVVCKFRPGDTQTYTYHNDGEPVAVGDTVKVPGAEGWSRAKVVRLDRIIPSFPTKPIEGRLDEQSTPPAFPKEE